MSSFNHRRSRGRFDSGFTLLELLSVIAIVAILMSIGVPSFRYVTNANRISSESNGLLGDLQFARSEAIREGQYVTACVSTDGATCSANSTAWQKGWIVFSDPNNNQTVDAGETVLRSQSAFSNTGSTDTFVGGNNLAAVTFNREGFTTGVVNGTLVTLHTATPTQAWTRCLSINSVGLMAISNYGGACT